MQNGTLQLTAGGTIGGAFAPESGAVLELGTNYTIADGTLGHFGAGLFQLANNITVTLRGTLNNNGTVNFANSGNGIDLRLSGNVSLAGTGIVNLNAFSNNRVFANAAGHRLTIGSWSNHTGQPAISASARPPLPTTARSSGPTSPTR